MAYTFMIMKINKYCELDKETKFNIDAKFINKNSSSIIIQQ